MAANTWTILETIVLVIVFIAALCANVSLFYIVGTTRNLQTKANVFILNLAVADLLVAVINLPVTIITVIAQDWVLGKTLCQISGFLTLLTFVASCMALSMISINRYHAIVYWTCYESKYTRRKCAFYVCITWFITIMLSIPPFFGWAKFDYDPGQSYCFVEWKASKSYTIFMIATCSCGLLSIMTYCYVRILRYHEDSGRDVRQMAVRSNSPSLQTLEMMDKAQGSRKNRLTRTVIVLIVVFGICWSPFAIIILIQVFSNAHVPRAVDFGSLVLGYLNSFFNVVVYNATNKKLRRQFLNFFSVIIFRKKDKRSQYTEGAHCHRVSASTGNNI
ncbi:melatonin receptor type 1C-like [Xenia sp. Carnegie-2017]|uniref:melatonin receptor type 1C-like n=1 Tax=Xenia sp. Carnegie-2017 TaxID=2897299 RepID=UPI001F03D3C3|nr:melatonin receptor type 1C-like [Xenia sp. Carnegie-2017]XP_046861040.1 melatonin receptor type 1C-like [Xenia sp. Carnegie-2017]XP_046861041.1 melatonin receptor type 1C-like [Xenia sp. Carnegie-2017]